MKNNKKIIGIIGVLAMVIVFCVGAIEQPLLTINGKAIYKQEYMMVVEREKSNVYNYFYHVYGVQPGDLKWEQAYGEEVPLVLLEERCNNKLIENNMIFDMAYEEGIINYRTFNDFLKVWKREMRNRQEAQNNQQVVYGPGKMSVYAYYDYVVEDIRARLVENFWIKQDVSEAEIETYYESIKDPHFIKTSSFKGKMIKGKDEGGTQQLEEVYNKLKNNDAVQGILEEVEKWDTIEVESIIFNERSARRDEVEFPKIRPLALQMQGGEVLPVFDNDNDRLTEVLVAEEVEETRYYSYEEVKASIREEYKRQCFDTYLLHNQQQAITQVNKAIIKNEMMEGLND